MNKIIGSQFITRAIRLSLVSTLANVLGFLIPVYIAYEYGVSKETDDFFLSYGIITFIGVIFSGAVRAVSVPFLKERLANKKEFNLFVTSLFYYVTVIIGLVCLVILIACLALYFNTNSPVYWYMCLSIPIILLTILNSFCYGILNSMNQFYLAELSPLSRSIVIFITIFVLNKYLGISAVIIGYVLGESGKFIHLIWVVLKKNNIEINFANRDYSLIKTFLHQGSFQIASTSLSSAAPLINKVIASFLIVGSISILDYGDRLFMIFNVLLNSFLTLILPVWSSDFANGKFNLEKLKKPMIGVFVLSSVALLIVSLMKGVIVERLYPNISSSDRSFIGDILIINMIGFIFNSLSQIINRATIAMKATKIMLTTSIVRTVLNIVVGLLFAKLYGVIGIAIATVIIHFIAFPLSYYMFKKEYETNFSDNNLNSSGSLTRSHLSH